MDLTTILPILIKDILIPEVAAIIRAHANASNGTLPTDAQVLAAFGDDVTRYTTIGKAFLAEPIPPAA